jgi:type III pantothenate kinase
MILLLDVGNTNIKAGMLDEGVMTPLGSVRHRDVGLGPAIAEADRIPGKVSEVVICSVAGPQVRRELEAVIRDHLGVEPEFIIATREACGVTNAYPEAHRLGADRWAGLIGAQARGYKAACIVDAGSALTIDGLINGRHIGGLIAPGIGLMRSSLFSETGNLRVLSEEPLEGGMSVFANDTHESIIRGTLLAAASLIQRSRQEMVRRVGKSPDLLLSGGDAEALLPLLDEYVEYLPHLTLEGLARLATEMRSD